MAGRTAVPGFFKFLFAVVGLFFLVSWPMSAAVSAIVLAAIIWLCGGMSGVAFLIAAACLMFCVGGLVLVRLCRKPSDASLPEGRHA